MDKYCKRWLDYYRSPSERKRRLRALERFRRVVGHRPAGLLERARKRQSRGQYPEALEAALRKYYKHVIDEGRAKSTAFQWYSVVRSYFTKNLVALPRIPPGMDSGPVWETTDVLSQEEVQKMVQSRTNPRDKAIIVFLAQTGQRIGVLTAMKGGMIDERRDAYRGYGLVEVPGGSVFQSRKGENVNRNQVRYKFVIGKDTMRLIKKLPKYEGGWLFDITERQIGRIVNEAAIDVGIQKPIETKVKGRSLHRVHPDVFRRYWRRQMGLGGIMDPDLLDFLMGNRSPRGRAVRAFPDEDVLEAYKEAESRLRVLIS